MKIEIGESLAYSWLRHIKKCQIVQTNWKPSPLWSVYDDDTLQNLINKAAKHFRGEYDLDLLGKNSGLSQFLLQAEIDVFGVHTEQGQHTCYALDIAYHISGTNYGDRIDTVTKIIKKLLRSAICICAFFNIYEGELIFASPKMTPSIYMDLEKPLKDLTAMLNEAGFEFVVSVVANQDFNDQILSPVINISGDVADTSELFLRSHQMLKLFDTSTVKPKIPPVKENGTAPTMHLTKSFGQMNDKPNIECILHGNQCDLKTFQRALVAATRAQRTIIYADGRQSLPQYWDTNNFTETSSLSSNIFGGPLRGWKDKGIIGIRIEIE
jgi:hypothetical protein